MFLEARGQDSSSNTMRLYRHALRLQSEDLKNAVDSDIVRKTLRHIQRTKTTVPRQAYPITLNALTAMLEAAPNTLLGLRDKVVLSLGFTGALRRSELVNLEVQDISFEGDGILLTIRGSKTDQAREGQQVPIPPGRRIFTKSYLTSWMDKSGIQTGYVLQTVRNNRPTGKNLTGNQISVLVKHYAKMIGLDPTRYSAHSLRAGFVTSAAQANAPLEKIQEVTRHKNIQTLLSYIRNANLLANTAGERFL